MQSFHAGSRREGAQTLGRLGDPRGVPPLVDALKHDSSKDVRIASAVALGEIGGHEAEVVLNRCIVYEKKEDVRVAAAGALRMLKERETTAPPPQIQISAVPRASATRSTPAAPKPRPPVSTKPKPAWLPAPAAEAASPFNRQFRPEPFTKSPSQSLDEPLLDEPLPAEADRTPPPPPTPVVPE
jgi:HEAT repeat protein